MIGISLRHAISLGLHLRNTDPTVYESRKDTLTRTWWTAYSIECLLNIVTGRPPVISEEYCTVPLPNSLLKKQDSFRAMLSHTTRGLTDSLPEQISSGSNHPITYGVESSTALYINGRIGILQLMREAQRCLYSPRTATQSWKVSSSHLLGSSNFLLVGLRFYSPFKLACLAYLTSWRDGAKQSGPQILENSTQIPKEPSIANSLS
jgi:hypothetical protein